MIQSQFILQNSVLTILNSHLLTVLMAFTVSFIKNIFLFMIIKLQQKNEFKYLEKKHEELKSGNIVVENDDNVENGNDFVKCKIIHSNQ